MFDCPPMLPVTGDTIFSNLREAYQRADSKSRASIYRVPKELRELSKSAYTPQLVSIGPLHSRNKSLIRNSDIKKYYVSKFLHRMHSKKNAVQVLNECLQEIRSPLEETNKSSSLLKEAQNRYADKVDELSEEMLVIDGCFILEVLYSYYEKRQKKGRNNKNNNDDYDDNQQEVIDCGFRLEILSSDHERRTRRRNNNNSNNNNNHHGQKEDPNTANNQSRGGSKSKDPILGHPLRKMFLKHDLLLLENQLPLFVLDALFRVTLQGVVEDGKSLAYYVKLYFAHEMNIMSEGGSDESVDIPFDGNEPHHILHFIHNHYVQPQGPLDDSTSSGFCGHCSAPKCSCRCTLACLPFCKKDNGRWQFRSASELSDALVKFEAPSTEAGPPRLEAKFHRRTGRFWWWWRRARFDIPSLCIYDDTEPFLRNLIAFEQCCPNVDRRFTWYACLMDQLISSEDDVKVLEKDKVIRHHLGDREEVADLFNKLCKLIVPAKDFAKDKEYKLAVDYSNEFRVNAIAKVRRKFFAGPFTFIAFGVAAIAFLMSVTQFVLSFF